MLLHGFFQRFKSSASRREVLKTCIEDLSIDRTQKDLFLWSIEFLDDNGVELLYTRISGFVSELEFLKIKSNHWAIGNSLAMASKREAAENEKERNSFKILLDSI
jgi:hypothetical protein